MALAVWQRTITDSAGNALPGATVEVRLESSGNLAALKADRAGAVPAANPISADGNGFVRFYVPGGVYRITASYLGEDSETLRHVAIGTAAETDTSVGTTREHTAAGNVTVAATDACVIVNKTVGEATQVDIPAADDRNGVDVIIKDGRGDADINPITPSIDGGQLIDGNAASEYVISTPYGHLWLRPKPDGSGYIQLPSGL